MVNKLGIRFCLAFGGIGYSIYAISLLVSVHAYVPGFNIFAGALLGVCAGLLWTAQGTIMLSYPTEEQKGRYFAWFWSIFNIGGCLGSLVRIRLCCAPVLPAGRLPTADCRLLTAELCRSLSAKTSMSRRTRPSRTARTSASSC